MSKMKEYCALVLILVMILSMAACKNKNGVSSSTTSAQASEEEQSEKFEFPYELDDGKLVVNSLFQSSVANPDYNNEDGEDIATLEIVNQSEEYLSSATITVTLEDGSVLNFSISGMPSGAKVWAFETGNNSIATDINCESIECDSQYSVDDQLMSDQIAVEIDNTSVTLTNLTEGDLTDLVVYCHCLFDGMYFGGLTYGYPVESVPAGGTAVIEADDCYLGSAEVVCIAHGN